MNKIHLAFLAIATFINAALQTNPVTIVKDENRYQVNGLVEHEDGLPDRAPIFLCRTVNEGGTAIEGGLNQLPVTEEYCRLILSHVTWDGISTDAPAEKAMAAGAGGGASGGA